MPRVIRMEEHIKGGDNIPQGAVIWVKLDFEGRASSKKQ